jgi:cytochrome c peroxidase
VKTLAYAVALVAVLAVACGGAEPTDAPPALVSPEARAALEKLSPEALPVVPADVSNAFADDPAAAALGQKLFFETRFSGALLDGDNDSSEHALGLRGATGKVACASCHVPKSGFVDDRSLGASVSLGSGWGRRRSPSLLDVGQAKLVMWDGRHDALYNQPFGPIESAVEMNSSRLFAAEQLFLGYRAEYEAIFGPLPPLDDTARFPALAPELTGCQHVFNGNPPTCDGTKHGMPDDDGEFSSLSPGDQDAVTRVVVNLGKALAAYERRLTCGTSRFDAWVHGQSDALSASEQRGAQLFVGKAHCVDCHSGAFFSDQKFHNVGLAPATVAVVFRDDNDRGAAAGLEAALADPLNVGGVYSDGEDDRLPDAVTPDMEGAFRTPMLRCVDMRPAFMHTGQLDELDKVVQFFDHGGDPGGYLGKNELTPLNLADEEQADLVAFLQALRGPGPDQKLLVPPN